MGLQRVKEIELISAKDDAVESLNPFQIKEGKDPFVFVFKNPNSLEVRDAYLLKIASLQKKLSINKNLGEISDLNPEQQVELINEISNTQFDIIDLLMIGYRERINGNLLPKSQEILEIMRDNDVILEFFTKLSNKKEEDNNKKKS